MLEIEDLDRTNTQKCALKESVVAILTTYNRKERDFTISII